MATLVVRTQVRRSSRLPCAESDPVIVATVWHTPQTTLSPALRGG